jgi:6-pyruvoyltetrahydropterin/6-carboxytetrahydropterin synthase
MEVLIQGETLDENGYLVDIDAVNDALTSLVDRYRDRTLNELPEFDELNPSIEHFARICCSKLMSELRPREDILSIEVKMWEDELAWASYSEHL